MMKIEKKEYIAPYARTKELKANALLAGSDLTSGGDNNQPGAPTEAESKHSIWNYTDEPEL